MKCAKQIYYKSSANLIIRGGNCMLTATFVIVLIANCLMIASLLWYKIRPRHLREYPFELVALVGVNVSYICWLGSNSNILTSQYNTTAFMEQITNLCATVCSHELIYVVLNLVIAICMFLYIFMVLLVVAEALQKSRMSVLFREAIHILSTGAGILAIYFITLYL